MAILGKTSITELNLITPLSNANLENSKITINGTAVPLGGSITTPDTHHEAKLVTASGTTSTSNTKDTANGVYFNLVENGQVRSNTILSGKTNITVTSDTAGTVLITGPNLSGYKTTQTAVSSPTASTATTTTFIDTISQNTNGVITATKKTLPITDTWNGTSTTTILSQKGAKSLYDSVVAATKTNADNAAASATSASTAASTATSKASAASTSASNAKTSETNAAASASNAKTSETNAAASATSASTAASTATSKASAASTSASNAKTSETNASSSASAAAASATAAATSATQVANSLSNYYTKTDFPKDHSTTANTYGLATSGSSAKYGHVKLVGGDVSGQTYSNGVAAAAAHTHGNYATIGHKHVAADITGGTNGYFLSCGSDGIGKWVANPNTATHMYLGASGATADATSDVTNPYITLYDGTAKREDIRLSGATNVSVKGKNGVITITGPNLSGYLTTGGTAADSSKLGGVAASGYLTTGGTAADSSKLGGTAAADYATQAWVNGKNYITSAATVADSNKLGGVAASGYLTTGGTAANASKLGGVAASQYIKYSLPDSDIFTNFTAYPYFAAKYLNGQGDFGTIVIPTYANNNADYFYQTELRFDNNQGLKYRNVNHENVGDWYTIATKSDLPGVFTGATSTTDGKAGLVKAPVKGNQTCYLKGDGTWGVPTNTVCTAGAYNTNDKRYLIGAPGQTDNQMAGIVTNSNSDVYMQDGGLYANFLQTNSIRISDLNYFYIGDEDYPTLLDVVNMMGNQTGVENNTEAKLYLVGSSSQDVSNITNTCEGVYMEAGKLYANGSEVGTMETINNTVSALTASNVSLDARISAIESGGAGGSVSVTAGSGTTYLVGTPSSSEFQTLSEAVFNPSVYIQSGQCYATAFYQTSDETLKDFHEEIGVDFEKLKTIPKKYFSWKDRRKDGIDIGTSAQALQKVYPELVSEGDNGLTVDYARLSVVALKAIDKLHEENEMLKEMLAKMDERLSKLENEK